jgi:hypothetical protein
MPPPCCGALGGATLDGDGLGGKVLPGGVADGCVLGAGVRGGWDGAGCGEYGAGVYCGDGYDCGGV